MGKTLSVYFANEEIRICEVSKSGGNVVVNRAFDVPLPSGIVEDGSIVDTEGAAKLLREAIVNNNIKRAKLAFLISSRKIANKEIVIPYVRNTEKVKDIINANLDEYFPMNNLEDYIYRHTILDTFENAEGKHYSVLVMAFQKQMIEGYYQLADELKMPVAAIDYYSNSIYQLLKKQLNQGTVLALQMDREITYVSIMRGKAQLFKRSVPFGKDTIVRNLAELKGMTEEEAGKILSDPERVDKFLNPREYSEIIQDFSAAVTRVVEFHTSRNPGTVIELVKLMGTGVGIIGFSEMLGRELGIEVSAIKEAAGVKIHKKNPDGLNYEKLLGYLPNLGICFAPLDLKVEEKRQQNSNFNTIIYILIAAAILVNLAVAGFFLWQYYTLSQTKAQLENDIAAVQDAEATYNMYNDVLADYGVIADFYKGTQNSNEMLYTFLTDLEKAIPESVGITNFSAEDGSVSITGIAGGKEALAKFVSVLKNLSYVTNVRIENVTDTYDEMGNSVSSFNMTLDFVLVETDENTEEGGES